MHDTASVTATEPVRAEVGAVAGLAVHLPFPVGGSSGVESLIAYPAREAALVPLPTGADHLLGVVHGLTAARALWGTAKL